MIKFLKFLPLCFLISCTSKAQDCKSLFIKAGRTYENYLVSRDQLKLDSALFFVDQAIKCAPDNSTPKLLKAQILFANHDYQSVLSIIRQLDPLKQDPNLNSTMGFTFERLNLSDSSKLYYQKSLEGYSELLKLDSLSSSNLLGYLGIVYIVKGKEEFEKEVDKYGTIILSHGLSPENLKISIVESYKISRREY